MNEDHKPVTIYRVVDKEGKPTRPYDGQKFWDLISSARRWRNMRTNYDWYERGPYRVQKVTIEMWEDVE